MSKPTLKPCPFCGAGTNPNPFASIDGPCIQRQVLPDDGSRVHMSVDCGNCGASVGLGVFGMGVSVETMDARVAADYNHRATEDNLHVQLQELLDYIDQFGTHTDDRRVTKARERAADFRERCAEGDPTSIAEAEQG